MYRVLVVDDSKFMRMLLTEKLQKAGCEVIEAECGYDAVDIYRENNPDMVTMDILMPDQDGIETLQQIKEEFPDAKVVMVTALGMEDHIERALSLGAVGCIIKPFAQEQVDEVVHRVLG